MFAYVYWLKAVYLAAACSHIPLLVQLSPSNFLLLTTHNTKKESLEDEKTTSGHEMILYIPHE